jgi:hypothetical protein
MITISTVKNTRQEYATDFLSRHADTMHAANASLP